MSTGSGSEPFPEFTIGDAVADQDLTQQARARLRRIEGQVRGIPRMLDRMDEEPDAEARLVERVHSLLESGKPQAEVARTLSISRRRVSDIARGRPVPNGEPCDGLLTQILAVRAAVEQVGLIIMEIHLQCCILDGVAIEETKVHELRDSLRHWSHLSSS